MTKTETWIRVKDVTGIIEKAKNGLEDRKIDVTEVTEEEIG